MSRPGGHSLQLLTIDSRSRIALQFFITSPTAAERPGQHLAETFLLERILVSSKSLRCLDIAHDSLNQTTEATILQIDGTVSVAECDQVRRDLDEPESGFVLLMTGDSGGASLDLTCASTVAQCEIRWNANTEYQAVYRAHHEGASKQAHRYLRVAWKQPCRPPRADHADQVSEGRRDNSAAGASLTVYRKRERRKPTRGLHYSRRHDEGAPWPDAFEAQSKTLDQDQLNKFQIV